MGLLGGGIVSMWRKNSITITVLLLNLALWVIVICAAAEAGGVWNDSVMHLLLAAYVSSLVIIWAVLAVLGLRRLHKSSLAGFATLPFSSRVLITLSNHDCVYYIVPAFASMSTMCTIDGRKYLSLFPA